VKKHNLGQKRSDHPGGRSPTLQKLIPVAVEAARDMASRIPGAKFKEYPGNSHSMMLDDMETVLSDIQEFITGERPIDSSDRILATVLFLDIASSTERAAELGDTSWRNILNSYYTIVRKEWRASAGRKPTLPATVFSRHSTVRRERCAARSQLRWRSDNSVSKYVPECTPANVN